MHVTIVDDLMENLICYSEMISEHFEVSIIQNPRALAEHLRVQPTDLILMDLHMPGITGFELYEKLKIDMPLPPVIFLTGDGSEESLVRALELGAEDFIVKPVTSAELIARVKNKILKTQEKKSQILKLENLTIYFDHQMVQINDQVVSLTPIEYKIISLFVRKPHKTITREEIIKFLWPEEHLSKACNIDTHISNLRKKLGEFNGRIKTIKSLGYILQLDS